MPSTGALPDPPLPLPQAAGPKMPPFTPTAYADIEFIAALGNPGEDVEGHVWEFLFQHSEDLRTTEGRTLLWPLASPRRYLDYLDPFNCECRAYGRLRAEQREDLAVGAHGYLLLTPEQEAEMRWEEHLGVPVRAIVKDLALEDKPWTPAQQPALWRDLEDLHALGILVRDITVFNYVGGKLVDLGHAWTMPHPCLDYIDDYFLAEERQKDPLELDCALVDWGIANDWTTEEFRLRPDQLKLCAAGNGAGDPYGTDPLLYDWRRCEEDVDAAEDFWADELYAPLPEPEPEQQAKPEGGAREGNGDGD
ncbi:kinetochore Sim4 complex subunit FTA2-domain-containing protein [Staphylotrichum tortipilum]|uniref:Kinetochore Sim4 complex subunit FTA2-domain-containing protein n=1 Tax=Staphylotrichum tortipilum TaxID=2831512 RepID=A0AAN6MJA9_9PEZI|nr:kinetochore Sim4 complex subunit FTA2-domain-containing protein [Staphylotrichum longicolle]